VGVVFPCARTKGHLWHLCRLLLALGVGSQGDPTLWLGGRQDRFSEGLVKGARFPDPRCLPSDATPHTAHARERERSRRLRQVRGAHVMRIAKPRRAAPLSPRTAFPVLARGENCKWLGPRSRASCTSQAFDPRGADGALLWARRRATDFCNTTTHGHSPRARLVLDRGERRLPLTRVRPRRAPSRGHA